MSGSSSGLIPMGNGLFLNPVTGTMTTGQPGQMGGPMAAQNAPAQPLTPPQASPPASAGQGQTQGPPPGVSVPTTPAGYPPSFGSSPVTAPQGTAPAPSSGGLSPQTMAALSTIKANAAASGTPTAPPSASPATTPAASTSTPPTAPPAAPTAPGFFPNTMKNLSTEESGGDPNAQNPKSSAKGPYQFLDSTWNQYLQTPEAKSKGYTAADVTNPTASLDGATWLAQQNAQSIKAAGFPVAPADIVSSHLLGVGDTIAIKKALAANPNTPMSAILGQSDPNSNAIFKENPGFLTPTDTVAQYYQKASNVASTGSWKGTGQTGQTGQTGTTGTAGTGQPGATPGGFQSTYQQMMATLPQPGALPQAPQLAGAPPLLGMNPSGANQALSFASGMLSGHSFGDGLGKGFGNLAATRQQQMQTANDAREQTTALNNSAAQTNFSNKLGIQQTGNDQTMARAQAGIELAKAGVPVPVGFQPVQMAGGGYGYPMRNPLTGQMSVQPIPGSTPESVAAIQQRAAANTQEKTTQDAVQASTKSANEFEAQAPADLQQIRVVNNALVGLDQNGGAVGPGVRQQLVNWFVNKFQLPSGSVTPNGLALTQNAIADSKLGDIGNLRNYFTQLRGPELNAVKGIMMGEDVNPQALKTGLQELQADVQARTKIRGQWDQMPDDQKSSVMSSPGGFSSWQSKQYNSAYVDPTSPANAPNVPAAFDKQGTYTGTAGIPASGTPSGATAGASPAQSLPHVANAQDYNAIPKGSQYVGPDGVTRTKQ